MAEVKWIKLSVGTFDDEKIKLIEALPEGDALLVIWCKLLCLAGKVNDNGYIYIGQNVPYTDEMLAVIFGRPVNTVRLAVQTFEKFGMIENTSDGLFLVNWGAYQNLDGLDRIREGNRVRIARFREKQKLLDITPANDDVTLRNVTVTQQKKKEERRKKKEDTTPISPSLPKVQYAENVHMTEKEHDALVALVGDEGTAFCIDKLDTYKAANGKKYKSDYAAIRNWAIDRWEQEKKRRGANGRGGADRSPVGYYEPHDASHYDQFTVQ